MAGRSRKPRKSEPSWKVLIRDNPDLSCSYVGRFFGRIEDEIEISAEDGLERGMTFCADNETGKVFATQPCSGDKCSLSPVKCESGEELYGDFHVHPSGTLEPSMSDLYYSLHYKQRVGCIGGTQSANRHSAKTGKWFKIPETAIKCYAFDLENPEYGSFRERVLPKMREAANIGSKLVDKQLRRSQSISHSEWQDYKKIRDNVMGDLKESNLFLETCPIITESFGEVRRCRVERGAKIK